MMKGQPPSVYKLAKTQRDCLSKCYYTTIVEYCQYKDTFGCLIFMPNKTIAPKQGAILIRIMYRNFNERIWFDEN